MSSVSNQILDSAQAMIQKRGYNGFSYRDIASEVGVKSSSIHYYFPSKANLCEALIKRYRRQVNEAWNHIFATEADPNVRLAQFVEGFVNTYKTKSGICLCGTLSADAESLNDNIRKEVQGFFADCEHWLAMVLADGRVRGLLNFQGQPETIARTISMVIPGGLLAARVHDDEAQLTAPAAWLSSVIGVPK